MLSFMVITPFQQICREKLSAVSLFSIRSVFMRAKKNWHDRHVAPTRSGCWKDIKKGNNISRWSPSLWVWGNCRFKVNCDLRVSGSSCLSNAPLQWSMLNQSFHWPNNDCDFRKLCKLRQDGVVFSRLRIMDQVWACICCVTEAVISESIWLEFFWASPFVHSP